MALFFAIPEGRSPPTVFATVVNPALVVSSAPGQDDPASPEDPSTSDSVVVLCDPRRTSFTNSFRNLCNEETDDLLDSSPLDSS